MSVAENGAGKRVNLGDVVRGVRNGAEWVHQQYMRNPRQTLALGAIWSLIPLIPIAGGIYNIHEAPRIKAENTARESAQATATAVAIANLNTDYAETGGVNLTRQQESYLAVPRGSARLAPSEGTLLDNAWARVKKESGCQIAETTTLPEVKGPNFWDLQIAPKSYVIRINC